MFVATLANHAVAGVIGVLWVGRKLTPAYLDLAVGISMVGMALWMLKPDEVNKNDGKRTQKGVVLTTLVAFFIAEIGDKTQIATVALAAGYSNLFAVVAGTTCGMLAANAPVIFLGNAFAGRLPMRAIRYTTTLLFSLLAQYSSIARYTIGLEQSQTGFGPRILAREQCSRLRGETRKL